MCKVMYIDTPDTPRQRYVPAGASFPAFDGDRLREDQSGEALRLALRSALRPPPLADFDPETPLDRAQLAELYAVVAARVVVLRADGLRAERVLLALKRETNLVIDALAAEGVHVDGARASEVLKLVVRWSVEAYHRSD